MLVIACGVPNAVPPSRNCTVSEMGAGAPPVCRVNENVAVEPVTRELVGDTVRPPMVCLWLTVCVTVPVVWARDRCPTAKASGTARNLNLANSDGIEDSETTGRIENPK